METSSDDSAAVRAFNAQAAANYDQALYDPLVDPLLDPERLFGLASLYGCAPDPDGQVDVLDIGCGTGSQLDRIGSMVSGALVGTDISQAACTVATSRLNASHPGRGRILAADLLDLDPDSLGRFDLIYCVGTLYVTPQPVRRRILEIVGRCLKPGGTAVFSYYAGAGGALEEELNRMMRAAAESATGRTARVSQVRAHLDTVMAAVPKEPGYLPTGVAGVLDRQSHLVLFHECLCEAMTSIHTGELHAALRPDGVQFLNYIAPIPQARQPTPDQRADAADIADFRRGGYRFALFGKPREGFYGRIAPTEAGLHWHTGLARTEGPRPYLDPAEYQLGGVVQARVPRPTLQAVLDQMGVRPAPWAEIHEGALRRLAAVGVPVPDDPLGALDMDLEAFWHAGLIYPLWGRKA